MWNG
jgi:hypothetical protein